MIIKLKRFYNHDCVIGRLEYGKFNCMTLELPYKNNQPNISAIPEGVYPWFKRNSPKNGDVIELDGVPNRTYIQIHAGNYTRQIKGCILVGRYAGFLDDDSTPDVSQSGVTLSKLLDVTPDKGNIRIY